MDSRTGHFRLQRWACYLGRATVQKHEPSCATQQQNPCETPLRDPHLRDPKKNLARPQKFFQPRPVTCNIPYPLHREILTQSILPLGKNRRLVRVVMTCYDSRSTHKHGWGPAGVQSYLEWATPRFLALDGCSCSSPTLQDVRTALDVHPNSEMSPWS